MGQEQFKKYYQAYLKSPMLTVIRQGFPQEKLGLILAIA